MFEYMVMARPVVAPKKQPVEAVITDGIDGYLFEPNDRNSFYKALSSALESKELSLHRGDAARIKVLDHYLWKSHASTLLNELYE